MSTSDNDGTYDVTPQPDDDPTPPFGFPLPPVRPKRSYRKAWLSLVAAAIAIILITAGYTAVRFIVDNSTYDDGHAAYQRADCAAAITAFDDVINAWRITTLGNTLAHAESEKAECLPFHEAAKRNEAGNLPGALAAYATFIPNRPPSPLVDAARTRITDLFKQPDISHLASIESCDTLPLLRDQKLLDPNAAPFFLASCGSAYVHGGERQKAISTYASLFADHSTHKVATDTEAELLKEVGWCSYLPELRNNPVLSTLKDLIPGLLLTCAKSPDWASSTIEMSEEFLTKYPGHRFTSEILTVYAAALNRAARANDQSKDFGKEDLIGPTPGDKAIIMLYNDSPEKLRIALSGPEPRVEEVAPCPNCPRAPANSPSTTCRKAATLKRITITPGEYDLALDFAESTKTNGGHAHWTLQPGKQYFACYYISERPN